MAISRAFTAVDEEMNKKAPLPLVAEDRLAPLRPLEENHKTVCGNADTPA
jgi:hypothetical protein